MNEDQARQAGAAFAKAHIDLVLGFYGSVIAPHYARGMAEHLRNHIREHDGERAAAYWFMALGQDSITQPEGA